MIAISAAPPAMDPRDHDAGSPFPPAVIAPADMGGRWFVAVVRPERAKTVINTLQRVEGVACYYPRESVQQRYGNRSVTKWTRALFPGYLPVTVEEGSEGVYAMHRLRDGIFDIITVRDQARFARELQGVHLATLNGAVSLYRLPVVGQKCEVIQGPLRGWVGTLISTANRWHFVLEVTTLGQRIEVSVPPEWLEPAGDEAAA